jgi:ubiquinone/menaquinone biosynthesis C-methylase UbiE
LAACVSAGVIVGVDRSHAIAQLARQRLDRAGLQARGRVVQAGAEALPFGNAQFDGALAINTLNLLDDRARGLSEIRRTLRPAARFVMVLQPRWLKTRAEVEALARAEHAWLVRAGFDAAQPLVTNLRPVPALLIVGTKRERRSGAD